MSRSDQPYKESMDHVAKSANGLPLLEQQQFTVTLGIGYMLAAIAEELRGIRKALEERP